MHYGNQYLPFLVWLWKTEREHGFLFILLEKCLFKEY